MQRQKQKHIQDLSPRQLWNLRKQITVNSLYYEDYENSYDIGRVEVAMFFDSWLEYLEEKMQEDIVGYNDSMFWDYFKEYDTCKYLSDYANTIIY